MITDRNQHTFRNLKLTDFSGVMGHLLRDLPIFIRQLCKKVLKPLNFILVIGCKNALYLGAYYGIPFSFVKSDSLSLENNFLPLRVAGYNHVIIQHLFNYHTGPSPMCFVSQISHPKQRAFYLQLPKRRAI